ncbi:hypothetical protein EDB89DRAFT_1915638 [Lactarius sanguifluus]|nr:hypothetical protein EDB89DRAFT_1915638 [Lactarius sanguifluus]
MQKLCPALGPAASLNLVTAQVIGSTAPRAGPFGVQGHHPVTLRRRDGAVALQRRHGALTATRQHSTSMLRHRRGTLVLRQPHGTTLPHQRRATAAWCCDLALQHRRHGAATRYDAVWSCYDSNSAPSHYDTDAAPQQLGAGTLTRMPRGHAVTATRHWQQVPTTPTPRCSNTALQLR